MKTDDKQIHKGHRNRLKESMLASDFNVSDINLLEALLFYSVSRADTNETAHRLINAFGSVSAVLEADIEDIKSVEGVGENSAFLIKLVSKLGKKAISEKRNGKLINSVGATISVLRPVFLHEKDEIMVVLLLDNSGRLIALKELARGTVNSASFDNRKLIECAMRANAASVILAHNHPHGTAQPSGADLDSTREARNLLNKLGISLLDHVIFNDDSYTSVKERKDFRLYVNSSDDISTL